MLFPPKQALSNVIIMTRKSPCPRNAVSCGAPFLLDQRSSFGNETQCGARSQLKRNARRPASWIMPVSLGSPEPRGACGRS